MSRLRANIFANYAGNGFVSAISLVVVPVYLSLLGPEAYGLIGFFTSFRWMAGVLEFGLSTVVAREVASRLASEATDTGLGKLVRTIEVVYWLMGLAAGGAMCAWAHYASQGWLTLSELSSHSVVVAAYLFGATIVATWPIAFYRGLLRGLERQVEYNIILSAGSLLRAAGSVATLVFIEQSLRGFLVFNLVAGVIEVLAMALSAWHYTFLSGRVEKRRFDYREIRKISGFMSQVSGITLLGIIVAQIDRLMISKLMPLEMLGYYTVASTLAGSLARFSGPIITAVFPRLTAHYANGDTTGLRDALNQSANLVSLIVAPVGIGLAWFSYETLLVWTRSIEAAEQSHVALALLSVGYVLNSMAHLDSNVQLAAGKTRFLLVYALVSTTLYVPGLYICISRWGVFGAAACWMSLNMLSYVALSISRTAIIFQARVSFESLFGNMHLVLMSAVLFGGVRLLTSAGKAGPMSSLAIAGSIGGIYLLWCLHRYQLRLGPEKERGIMRYLV